MTTAELLAKRLAQKTAPKPTVHVRPEATSGGIRERLQRARREAEQASALQAQGTDLVRLVTAAVEVAQAPGPIIPVPRKERPRPPGETMRVVGLPRVDYLSMVVDQTARYLRPGHSMPFTDASGSEVHKLRMIQSAILMACEACRGGLFPVGVGHGKAGAAVLAPVAMGCEVAIILTTSGTLSQLRATFATWRRVFRVDYRAHILSYDQLSTPNAATMLDRLIAGADPSKVCVIADEAHKLRHMDSARTRRVLRFFDEHDQALFVALSGTMTSKSLMDFAHLAGLALRHLAPVPQSEQALQSWAACIDVEGRPSSVDWDEVAPLVEWAGDDATGEKRTQQARTAFRSRLRSCPGVVATDEQAVQCSLVFEHMTVDVPEIITQHMATARMLKEDPDGEPIPDDISLWRLLRQLSGGYRYVWDWPQGRVDVVWKESRRAWNGEVREELKEYAGAGYDSEFLVAAACEQGRVRHNRPLVAAWHAWKEQRVKRWRWADGTDRPRPPTRTIWEDTFFVEDIMRRLASEKGPVVLWYESQALQDALRARKLDVRGAGEDVPKKAGVVALSIRSHGDGLNLQAWDRCILLEPPGSGQRCEQVVGRHHRPGQLADEVTVGVYQHTEVVADAFAQARADARYIEDATGNRQKLNYATFVDFPTRAKPAKALVFDADLD